MDGMTENLVRLEFGFTGLSVILAALILAAWSLFLAVKSVRIIEDGRLRRNIVLLRGLAVLLALFFVLQPSLVRRKVEKKRRALEMLVDASPSMRGPGGGLDKAASYLSAHRAEWKRLAERYDLRLSLFSADTLPDSLGPFAANRTTHFTEVTRLDDALKELSARDPAGIVLFSDGHLGDRYANRFKAGLPLIDREDVLSGTRFYPVLFPSDSARADIAITGVNADEFAYVKNLFTVRVRFRAAGLGAMAVPVRIKRGRETVAGVTVNTRRGGGEYEAVLEMTPEKAGYFIYTVSVPSYASEGDVSNNRSDFALKVIRDRIRVLQVCGRPSWDTRFLRQALKNDPAVDLIAFYILRTMSDYVNAATDELSLIEFPYQQLFERELHTFDLVIFQNFSYRTFFPPEYLSNVRKFVEQGGAFLMVGGDLSFSEGGYQGGPLEAVLPYRLVQAQAKNLQAGCRVDFTQNGLNHPVTSEAGEIREFAFEGYNRLGAEQAAAMTLMATRQGDPFFGIREVGKGRSAAIAGDGLWMMNFVNVGLGKGNRAYQELVRRTVRWLVKDPAVGSLSFSGMRQTYPSGAPITFSLKAANPGKGREIQVRIINASDVTVDRKRAVLKGAAALPMEFKNPGEGTYVVMAEVFRGAMVEDYATESFSVSLRGEYGEGSNTALLERLAEESGGRIIRSDAANPAGRIDAPALSVIRVIERKVFPIWNGLIGLLCVVLLFSLEWFIRKRNGLP